MKGIEIRQLLNHPTRSTNFKFAILKAEEENRGWASFSRVQGYSDYLFHNRTVQSYASSFKLILETEEFNTTYQTDDIPF